LLLMTFPCTRKLGNICCGHNMFLNKIRNSFCVADTKFVSATNVARAGKRGNICVGNNVSATMCPRLPVPLFMGMVHSMHRLLVWCFRTKPACPRALVDLKCSTSLQLPIARKARVDALLISKSFPDLLEELKSI